MILCVYNILIYLCIMDREMMEISTNARIPWLILVIYNKVKNEMHLVKFIQYLAIY